MIHTIIDNGIESTITKDQATNLLDTDSIYACDECDTLKDETIYHVTPDSEQSYEDATGPFAFLATIQS